MSDTLRRFVAPADGRQDWVFRAFVAFALVMGGLTALHRVRLDRALRRASTCLSQADAAGAGAAVEEARALEADHPRVRLVGMDLHVLLGEIDAAQIELASFEVGETSKNLAPAARGDLLLLQGDLDVAAGTFGPAKAHYSAAQLLVKDQRVVVTRLDRLAQREQRIVDERAALFSDFNHLFEEAQVSNADAVRLRGKDLSQRARNLTNVDARTKLFLAISAAERAAWAGSQAGVFTARAGFGASPRPPPPVRDDTVERTAAAERLYQRKLTAYQQALEVDDARLAALETARIERVAVASKTSTQNLTEARALVAEARAILEKEGAEAR